MKLKLPSRRWLRPATWIAAFLAVTVPLLTWRLASLAPATLVETASCNAATIAGPDGLVYGYAKLLNIHGCQPEHALWLRLPSVVLALVAAGLFVWALKYWLGKQAAVYGGLLFVGSAWFLHAGRFAGIQASLLLIAPLTLWLYRFVPRNQNTWYAGPVAGLAMSLLVSLPGGVWFALLLASLKSQAVVASLWKTTRARAILPFIFFVAGLAPLIYAFVVDGTRDSFMNWLGVSPIAAVDPISVIKGIAAIPAQLVLRGPDDVSLWLPGLPLLDFFVLVMSMVGLVWLVLRLKSTTRLLFIVSVIIAFVLAGISGYGVGGLSILMPLVYLCAAAGIRFFLHRWQAVFPANPFARSLAYGFVTLAVLVSFTYNVRTYFIAWPHNPQVLEAFRQAR